MVNNTEKPPPIENINAVENNTDGTSSDTGDREVHEIATSLGLSNFEKEWEEHPDAPLNFSSKLEVLRKPKPTNQQPVRHTSDKAPYHAQQCVRALCEDYNIVVQNETLPEDRVLPSAELRDCTYDMKGYEDLNDTENNSFQSSKENNNDNNNNNNNNKNNNIENNNSEKDQDILSHCADLSVLSTQSSSNLNQNIQSRRIDSNSSAPVIVGLQADAAKVIERLNEDVHISNENKEFCVLDPQVMDEVEPSEPTTDIFFELTDITSTLLQKFASQWGGFEPLFVSAVVLDGQGHRITESVHLDCNSDQVMKAFFPDASYPKRQPQRVVFRIPHSLISSDLFLVLRINRILQGDIEKALAYYTEQKSKLAFLGRGNNLKPDKVESFRNKAIERAHRMGEFRQPFLWCGSPIFDRTTEVILSSDTFSELYLSKTILSDKAIATAMNDLSASKLTSKPIPMSLGVRVHELPQQRFRKYVSEDKDDVLLVPDATSNNEKQEIEAREVRCVSSSSMLPETNVAYIYPLRAILKFKMIDSSRTVVLKMMVKDNDDDLEDDGIKCIYSKQIEPILEKTSNSDVSVHRKEHFFCDQFKLQLSDSLTKNHHILFAFYEVNIKDKKTKERMSPLAYGFLPLWNLNTDCIVRSGTQSIPVYPHTKVPSEGYLALSAPESSTASKSSLADDPEKEKTDASLTLSVNVKSPLYPEDSYLSRFFQELNLHQKYPEKDPSALIDTMENLKSVAKETVAVYAPVLLTECVSIASRSSEQMKTRKTAFGTLLNILSCLRSVEGSVENHNETSILSLSHLKLDLSLGDIAEPFIIAWEHHTRASSVNDWNVARDMIKEMPYLFGVILKSLILHLADSGQSFPLDQNQSRCSWFPESLTSSLTSLIDALSFLLISFLASASPSDHTTISSTRNAIQHMVRFLMSLAVNVLDRGAVLTVILSALHALLPLRDSVLSHQHIKDFGMNTNQQISGAADSLPKSSPFSSPRGAGELSARTRNRESAGRRLAVTFLRTLVNSDEMSRLGPRHLPRNERSGISKIRDQLLYESYIYSVITPHVIHLLCSKEDDTRRKAATVLREMVFRTGTDARVASHRDEDADTEKEATSTSKSQSDLAKRLVSTGMLTIVVQWLEALSRWQAVTVESINSNRDALRAVEKGFDETTNEILALQERKHHLLGGRTPSDGKPPKAIRRNLQEIDRKLASNQKSKESWEREISRLTRFVQMREHECLEERATVTAAMLHILQTSDNNIRRQWWKEESDAVKIALLDAFKYAVECLAFDEEREKSVHKAAANLDSSTGSYRRHEGGGEKSKDDGTNTNNSSSAKSSARGNRKSFLSVRKSLRVLNSKNQNKNNNNNNFDNNNNNNNNNISDMNLNEVHSSADLGGTPSSSTPSTPVTDSHNTTSAPVSPPPPPDTILGSAAESSASIAVSFGDGDKKKKKKGKKDKKDTYNDPSNNNNNNANNNNANNNNNNNNNSNNNNSNLEMNQNHSKSTPSFQSNSRMDSATYLQSFKLRMESQLLGHRDDLREHRYRVLANLACEGTLSVLQLLSEFTQDNERLLHIYVMENGKRRHHLFERAVSAIESLFNTPQPKDVMLCLMTFLDGFFRKFRRIVFHPAFAYSELFAVSLLRLCTSPIEELRRHASGLLYVFIQQGYAECKSFTSLNMLLTVSMSKLSNYITNERVVKQSIKEIIAYSERIGTSTVNTDTLKQTISRGQRLREYNSDDEKFCRHVKELCDRLENLLKDILRVSEYKRRNVDPETLCDLYTDIIDGYAYAPELKVVWIETLTSTLLKQNHYPEAGQCILRIAATVFEFLSAAASTSSSSSSSNKIKSNNNNNNNNNNKNNLDNDKKINKLINETIPYQKILSHLLGPSYLNHPEIPEDVRATLAEMQITQSTFTASGLVATLERAVDTHERGELQEHVLELYKLLLPFYESDYDYERIASAHEHCGQIARAIQRHGEFRIFGTYYRIAFFGKRLKELHNEQYIYKFPKITRLGDVCDYFEKMFGGCYGRENVELIRSSKKVDVTSLKDIENRVYIQIVNVEPVVSDEDEGYPRHTHFERNINIDKFLSEKPYVPDGAKFSEDVRRQYKHKVTMHIAKPFPSTCIRQKVVRRNETLLSPVRTAIEAVEAKAEHLEAEVQKSTASANIPILHMALSGVLRLQVNAGPKEFVRVFLGNGKEEENEPAEEDEEHSKQEEENENENENENEKAKEKEKEKVKENENVQVEVTEEDANELRERCQRLLQVCDDGIRLSNRQAVSHQRAMHDELEQGFNELKAFFKQYGI